MRDQAHCRIHLNRKPGPHNGGAPKGNFNALKSGRYANPLPPAELKNLALQLAGDPDSLPQHIDFAVRSIQGRTSSSLHTLILLTRFLNQLLPYLADIAFTADLESFIQGLPPNMRPGVQSTIWKHALSLNPLKRPLLVRAIAKHFSKKISNGKTTTGTGITGRYRDHQRLTKDANFPKSWHLYIFRKAPFSAG